MSNPLRTCTVLFCDIAQSTRYASVLGEQDYGALLKEYQTLGKQIVEGYTRGCAENCEYDIRGDQICFMAYSPDDEVSDARRVIALAQDLKMKWFFSHYNMVRRKANRPPVSIMIGIHTGKVAVDFFPRAGSTQVRPFAEGYAISIAKRVESHARHGSGWQIMITDGTLSLLKGTLAMEFVRCGEAKLTEGLGYPVSEFVDLPLNMARYVKFSQKDEAYEALEHVKIAAQIDPTPWHCLLWAYWNLYYRRAVVDIGEKAPEEDLRAYDQALLTNPHSRRLAEEIAQRWLRAQNSSAALDMIDIAAGRSRERQVPKGFYGVFRAMAQILLILQRGRSTRGDLDLVALNCQAALYDPEWHHPAKVLLRILWGEGSEAVEGQIKVLLALNDTEKEHPLIYWIHQGLDMAYRTMSPGEQELNEWRNRCSGDLGGWRLEASAMAITVLQPLLVFCSQHYGGRPERHRQAVYQTLSLLWSGSAHPVKPTPPQLPDS